MKRLRWVLASLSIALITSPTLPARAEPTPEQRAAAQALYDAARALTKDGRYAEACPKLLESHKLDPAPGTAYQLADCYEHVGSLASAWTYYIEVADAARAAGKSEHEAAARARAAAVKPRIPTVLITASKAARSIAGLTITRDGVPVGEGQLDAAIPVDPGVHVIVANAAGKQPWRREVPIQEGQAITVDVPVLTDPPPKPVAEPPPKPVAPPPPREPASRATLLGAQRLIGIGMGVAGAITAAVGFGFGGAAISKKNESNQVHCDAADTCDKTGLAMRADAISFATISTGCIIAGAAALVGGVVLVSTTPRGPSKPPATSVRVTPGGFVIAGSF